MDLRRGKANIFHGPFFLPFIRNLILKFLNVIEFQESTEGESNDGETEGKPAGSF